MCFLCGVNCTQGQNSKSMVKSVCVFSHLTDSMTLTSAVSFLLVQSSGIHLVTLPNPCHSMSITCHVLFSLPRCTWGMVRENAGRRGSAFCWKHRSCVSEGQNRRVLMSKLDHWLLEVWDAWLFFFDMAFGLSVKNLALDYEGHPRGERERRLNQLAVYHHELGSEGQRDWES